MATAFLSPATPAAPPAPRAPVQAPRQLGRGLATMGLLTFGSMAAAQQRRRSKLARAGQAVIEPQAVEVAEPAEPEVEQEEPEDPDMQSLMRFRAIPFLPEPAYRSYVRNVPGDASFDPLGLAGSTTDDFLLRLDAETKHGRIAMLAGLGFVLPELLHDKISSSLNMDYLMAEGGCTPTILNGGLQEPILATSVLAIFAVMGVVDLTVPRNTGLPGYYGWDPLNFGGIQFSDLAKGLLRSDTEWVAEAEVKHGRVAMVAVVYMAAFEAYTGEPIWPSL